MIDLNKLRGGVNMLAILVVFGLIPFALGGFMNWIMMTYSNTVPLFVLFAIVTLLIWVAIAFIVKPYIKNTTKIVIGLNFVAFVVLVLVGIQELLLHAYWQNMIGIWTQFYYLPLLNIGFRLTDWSHSVFSAYCMAFLLLVIATLLGCKLRKR